MSRPIPFVASEIAKRQVRREQSLCSEIWDLLDRVADPEIAVLSLWDLGVLQDVQLASDEELRISPAWTTDWISADGREALRVYGIAPPADDVVCPLCEWSESQLISEFGSIACKALHRCGHCGETFDYFKRL